MCRQNETRCRWSHLTTSSERTQANGFCSLARSLAFKWQQRESATKKKKRASQKSKPLSASQRASEQNLLSLANLFASAKMFHLNLSACVVHVVVFLRLSSARCIQILSIDLFCSLVWVAAKVRSYATPPRYCERLRETPESDCCNNCCWSAEANGESEEILIYFNNNQDNNNIHLRIS